MNPPVLDMPETQVKIKTPLPADGPICLNLGGAGEGFINGRIPGFLTVDLRDVQDTDIVSDISKLSWLGNETVEKIYCSNALEHFPIPQTLIVLKEWYRVLKPRGKMYISVPDFDAAVRLYLKIGLTDWISYLIWGDQNGPLNYHYINFTYPTLAALMIKAGFKDVKRVKEFPFGVRDASMHKDNLMHQPISLNVEVSK